MKVTLDTNVLIAAFIAQGTCHQVLEDVVRHHELVLSNYILDEFTEKLTEKLRFNLGEVREARTLLSGKARLVNPVEIETPTGIDPDDLPVLGTAVAGQCDCIVTGDRELLQLGVIDHIPILKPGDFWKLEDEGDF